jgi:hypothetical protein
MLASWLTWLIVLDRRNAVSEFSFSRKINLLFLSEALYHVTLAGIIEAMEDSEIFFIPKKILPVFIKLTLIGLNLADYWPNCFSISRKRAQKSSYFLARTTLR